MYTFGHSEILDDEFSPDVCFKLLQGVVNHLSEEPHLQHFCERKELMTSHLDSSESEMKIVCTGLATTFIILYEKATRKENSMAISRWSGTSHGLILC